MLTTDEQTLIRDAFTRGPTAFLEAGYSDEAIQALLLREDVRDYFARLDAELAHGPALEVRSRFMARRSLARVANHAVTILARAMAGPRYLRVDDEKLKDAHGRPISRIAVDARGNPILMEPEITPVQLRAAEATLDYLGVPPGKVRPAVDVDVNVKALYDQGRPRIEIESDPSHTEEAERSLSRERVRNVIAQIAADIPALRRKLDESLGITSTKAIEAEVVSTPSTKRKRIKKAAKRGGKKR